MAKKPWEHAKDSGSEGDPLATRFVASLDVDKRLYEVDIRGSLAHAAMLEKVGLITADEHAAIEGGLHEIQSEIDDQGDDWPGWKIELEDVHMCIEAALIEKSGDAGRKLHTGRSRNDQVATDMKVWIRDAANDSIDRIQNLQQAYLDLADRSGMIVMPSYTHLQRAQPIVLGGEMLAWVNAFGFADERFSRLAALSDWANPLGSGAIAGSSLPLDRMIPTYDLGFSARGASVQSIEQTASRDAAIDFVYALSMTAMWLSRWAEQWIIYNSVEFGFITLDPKYTTGSSMMPQKQNPDMLELIRGRCGGVYGHLTALLTMCKGLTIGYNRDLQEDKRHVFAAYDTVSDCLEIAAGIVRTTTFNEDRITEGLSRGYLDATSLAEYLVTRGVAFRTAHQIVGSLVRQCESDGLGELRKLSVARMQEAVAAAGAEAHADAVDEDVYDWLGPKNVVKRYQTAGNAGVSGFEEQLAAWRERLEA